MTKKDYVLIAAAVRAVRESYAPHWDPNLFRACDDHGKRLSESLSNTNPLFDRARFLAACGVTS